jgi:3-oxoacyl-[acyl-carrier-protein] synthase-1
MLSRIDRYVMDELCIGLDIPDGKYTFFEKMLLTSSIQAVRKAGIDPSSDRVLFIISTTKGNVSLLDRDVKGFPQERVLLGKSASMVSRYFGNPNSPVVVCNACISGVCAQIEAMRALQSGRYDYAVVTGADEQSPFIISGFLSFKALTDTPCRPFDKDRTGLNLGECAATVVLKASDAPACGWVLEGGAIRNDANHISGPSRTGEGSYLALMEVLRKCGREGLAFVNVHGTATAYNDEMESIALYRAGLIDVPVTGLKGYYGHTMGAAGIMESILSMYAVQDGTVLATRGYAEQGVTYPVNVSPENRPAHGNRFIKLLSGFGGCNAALSYAYYSK